MIGLFKSRRRKKHPSGPEHYVPCASWPEARRLTTGYDQPAILEKTRQAVAKVRDGEAVYERDTVLFDTIEHSFGPLSGLLRAAVEAGNRLTVLDFGGALGSSYFECRGFLGVLSDLQWWVVEQEAHVAVGQREFDDGRLHFSRTPGEAIEKAGKIDVLFISSVLSYLEDPHGAFASLRALDIPYLILDRTPFLDQARDDLLSIQNVPPFIYTASYPAWHFDRARLTREIGETHEILATFDAHAGTVNRIGSFTSRYGGLVAKRKAA